MASPLRAVLRAMLLAVLIHQAGCMVVGNALTKALGSNGRPLVVHIWDPDPGALAAFAIDDVSEACREAGAAAVLTSPALVGAMAKEQEKGRGGFPGPLPVIVDCALNGLDAEQCEGAKKLGASAVGIRYYEGDWPEEAALEEALRGAVLHAEQAGLSSILLAEFGADGEEGAQGADELAARVGAAAGLGKGLKDHSRGEDVGALALGCWDGSSDGLQRIRDEGFGGLVLKNACNGDVGWGSKTKQPSLAALALSKLIKAALSKGSTSIWGGAGGKFTESQGPTLDGYFNRDNQPSVRR